MRPRPATARQRGFALLIVLWTMALLALIGTQVTAAGRGETRLAANLRASAVAEQAADGAVFEAMFHLLDGSDKRWLADGRIRRIKTPLAEIEVEAVNEGRKMTLNNASVPMLRGLFHAVGLGDALADTLAEQVADWRSPSNLPLPKGAKTPQYQAAHRDYGPPAQPFRSVDELGLVLGVTPEVMARVRPYVSAFVESAPQAQGADPVIAQALADAQNDAAPPLAFDEAPTVTITAVAQSGGARFLRRAVVRLILEPQGTPDTVPFTILDWGGAGT